MKNDFREEKISGYQVKMHKTKGLCSSSEFEVEITANRATVVTSRDGSGSKNKTEDPNPKVKGTRVLAKSSHSPCDGRAWEKRNAHESRGP